MKARGGLACIGLVASVALPFLLGDINDARAQVLNQQMQLLLTNNCRGLSLASGQNIATLQTIGLGLQLAQICNGNLANSSAGPASGGGAASLQGSAASIFNRNMLSRLEEIRNEDTKPASSNSPSTSRLLSNPFGGLMPALLGATSGTAQGPASKGNAGSIGFSSSRWNGLGLFATGQAEILNRNIGPFQDGFKSNIFGLTVGADYRFSKTFVAGGSFTYANINGDFRQGGTFSTNAYTWTFFASYLPTERTFVQATTGTTLNNYLIARPSRIQIKSPGAAALNRDGISSSNSSGNVFSWTVLAGYDYSIRQFTFGPRLGLNYARTKIDEYSEQGGTGLELAYENQFFESFQSVLGVQGTAPFSWSYGVLIPQFNADYIHEFENSQRRINVQFAQDGRGPGKGSSAPPFSGSFSGFSVQVPTRFAFQNDVPARNYFNLGTGLIAILPNGYQPFVNFRAMVGNSQFTNYVWTFGLRIEL